MTTTTTHDDRDPPPRRPRPTTTTTWLAWCRGWRGAVTYGRTNQRRTNERTNTRTANRTLLAFAWCALLCVFPVFTRGSCKFLPPTGPPCVKQSTVSDLVTCCVGVLVCWCLGVSVCCVGGVLVVGWLTSFFFCCAGVSLRSLLRSLSTPSSCVLRYLAIVNVVAVFVVSVFAVRRRRRRHSSNTSQSPLSLAAVAVAVAVVIVIVARSLTVVGKYKIVESRFRFG